MAAKCEVLSVIGKTPSGARRSRRSAAGFTLVELLMVIAIIAMLMGLLSVAVWRALDAARKAEMLTEIEQLSNAMNGYKEANVQYPPSMSELVVTERKIHFMRHVQAAFTNANLGVTAAHFDNLRNAMRTVNGLGTGSQAYTFALNGSATLVDLNTLDQAEALVFWLGGMPTPCKPDGTPVASNRLFGFNKDRDSPFKRDAATQEATDPLRFRTNPYFDFKPERLADLDGDGWLEYLPQNPSGGSLIAPFVYFDADTYTRSTTAPGVTPFNITNQTGYPRFQDATAPGLAAEWGMAVPLARTFDVTGKVPVAWQNEKSFQIIAPGKDGKYGAPVSGALDAAMRLPVFPSGETYTKAGGYKADSRTSYAIEELDNLTNLGRYTLDEARQVAP
jgi:prepilin-type N-terminal cleavage/methylation domain-containing protein